MASTRPLPDGETDWDLLDQLIRVHQSVTSPGAWSRDLYDWWAKWNRAYFASKLRPLFVHSGNTDYGKYLGLCAYAPTREIVIQKKGIKAPTFADHHVVGVRRHEDFADLTRAQYGAALVLLHEMIHQACFEAGVWPGHEGQPWADHCNHIGSELGLGLTFTAMKRGKEAVTDEDGRKRRINVWRPADQAELLPGTDRLATFSEQRCFPFRDGDPFIVANTVTLTEGKAVKQNGGKPVTIEPRF